jgi:hypothetical protein
LNQQFSLPGREGTETNREIQAIHGTGGTDVTPIVPVVRSRRERPCHRDPHASSGSNHRRCDDTHREGRRQKQPANDEHVHAPHPGRGQARLATEQMAVADVGVVRSTSPGLVLVQSWLLAIPHHLAVAFFFAGGDRATTLSDRSSASLGESGRLRG